MSSLALAIQSGDDGETVQQSIPPIPSIEPAPRSVATGRPTVMIVDDETRNLKLLKGILAGENYHIHTFRDGREALQRVESLAPDIILLDIMMPGLDGFEVCRRLKQDEKTQAVPVVMVTALTDDNCQSVAVEAGADDFLNKPVRPDELRIRVKSLLRIKSYHDKLAAKYDEIHQKNQQLTELERTKDGLIHMIIHDLNNPLTAISSSLQLLSLLEHDISDKGSATVQTCLNNCNQLETLIHGLLDIHRLEDGNISLANEATDLTRLIQSVMGQLQGLFNQNKVELKLSVPSILPLFHMDPLLIRRVVVNLVSNALHHTPPGGEVCIEVAYEPEQKEVTVSVRDTGEGIAKSDQQAIFDKFIQVANQKGKMRLNGHGLGLAFCKLAIEAHHGSIAVHSEGKGKGSTFRVTLPSEN